MSKNTLLTADQLLRHLVDNGGAVVSSGSCSTVEIADARTRGDWYVDADGFGYVVRSREWLQLAEASVTQVRTEHDLPKPPDGYRWDADDSLHLVELSSDVTIGSVRKSSNGWTFTGGKDNVPDSDSRDEAAFKLLKACGLLSPDAVRENIETVRPA